MKEHEYKMYSIVLRHLDGQNKGVQTTHAVCEYVRLHWDDQDLQQWINEDKTLVMLSGGTVPDMDNIRMTLYGAGIEFEIFQEEDLGNLTTAICLLADERVWDRENYPSLRDYIEDAKRYDMSVDDADLEEEYIDFIGGQQNFVKKEILNNLRLA